MKKIAVTGCAGFIGSWICDKFLENGDEVIGIDNFSSGVNNTPKNVKFNYIDVNSNISNILKDVDAVVHASAKADVRHNWDNKSERESLFKNNEMATISVLEQMPNVPIIFLSTAAVYGSLSNTNNSILTEKDATPANIESPYAASKLACESYVAAWAYKKQIPWYCLRLVNQVGSRSHHGVISDFYNMAKNNNHITALDNGEQKKELG
jgi:nucleoside-diphosphate-sugar epimerase